MSNGEAPVAGPAPSAVFAAMGDPTRLGILTTLSDGRRRSIAALSAETRMTRQGVTKHLQVLEKAGLVSGVRVGRESRFTYRPERIGDARAYLDSVSARWDAALERLRALVED